MHSHSICCVALSCFFSLHIAKKIWQSIPTKVKTTEVYSITRCTFRSDNICTSCSAEYPTACTHAHTPTTESYDSIYLQNCREISATKTWRQYDNSYSHNLMRVFHIASDHHHLHHKLQWDCPLTSSALNMCMNKYMIIFRQTIIQILSFFAY